MTTENKEIILDIVVLPTPDSPDTPIMCFFIIIFL